MHFRWIMSGLAAVVGLGLFASVMTAEDYVTLPTEFDKPAKMLAEKKLSLAQIIAEAEKQTDAKATDTNVTILDGKLDIAVTLAAPGLAARVKIDPETGKLAKTSDEPYDNKISLIDAIKAAEKRTGGKSTGAIMESRDGVVTIIVRIAGPGLSARLSIDPNTGEVISPTQTLPDENMSLIAAVKAAEAETKAVATNAVAPLGPGPQEINVEVVGDNLHKQVKIDPATNKVISMQDLATTLPGAPVQGEPTKTPSGLQYYDIKMGDGESPPSTTSRVKVNYTGWLVNGKKFDSSVDRGKPAEFPLDGVIPGWTEGLSTMKVGGKRKLLVPGDLAYGPEGNRRGNIPPNATLIFDVELLEIVESGAVPPALKPRINPAGTSTKPAGATTTKPAGDGN